MDNAYANPTSQINANRVLWANRVGYSDSIVLNWSPDFVPARITLKSPRTGSVLPFYLNGSDNAYLHFISGEGIALHVARVSKVW